MEDKKLTVGNFDSLEDFAFYAEAHYLPLLTRLSDNESLTEADRKLSGFLFDDLKSLCENIQK